VSERCGRHREDPRTAGSRRYQGAGAMPRTRLCLKWGQRDAFPRSDAVRPDSYSFFVRFAPSPSLFRIVERHRRWVWPTRYNGSDNNRNGCWSPVCKSRHKTDPRRSAPLTVPDSYAGMPAPMRWIARTAADPPCGGGVRCGNRARQRFERQTDERVAV
jgi:hypothetical protein